MAGWVRELVPPIPARLHHRGLASVSLTHQHCVCRACSAASIAGAFAARSCPLADNCDGGCRQRGVSYRCGLPHAGLFTRCRDQRRLISATGGHRWRLSLTSCARIHRHSRRSDCHRHRVSLVVCVEPRPTRGRAQCQLTNAEHALGCHGFCVRRVRWCHPSGSAIRAGIWSTG